ncbi:MAG: type I DNA topoisomerase [Phycisphaerae bacterium]
MGKAAKRSSKRTGTATRPRSAAASASGKKLVIVESPAKARTINRYLGPDYVVRASMGHVRDLPTKNIGVDVEHGFAPSYELLSGRKKVVTELKKDAKSAAEVFLATDLDREGEAIAWHLAECLGVPPEHVRRVIFNEITRGAIQQAFAHPRDIDMAKVNAQQARRILDRIVGYEVSPLLWKKVAPGLSAGRVQSVAVRLIVEREREIDAFMPEEYWKITGIFTPDGSAARELARDWRAFLARKDERGNAPSRDEQQQFLSQRNAFRAELVKWSGQRFKTSSAEHALTVARAAGLAVDEVRRVADPDAKGPAQNLVTVLGHVAGDVPAFTVTELTQRESKSRPPAPFITSSLQQAASAKLRFSAERTMRTAQQLYEGVEIPGRGQVGLITYMRTDSRHLSHEAVSRVRSLIRERFGEQYVPAEPQVFTSARRAQEAHEAIRPTDAGLDPEGVREALTNEQYKLYKLIWTQFLACQMPPAVWKVTDASITAATEAGEAVFKAVGRSLAFDGFLRVTGLPKRGDQILPDLQSGQRVSAVQIDPVQHFTQPPPRYTEAALIRALEADGIGRPSTYASIIQTIQNRKYVRLVERVFHPTDVGKVVTDKLVRHFPKVFDVRFTASMEDQLDRVEESREDWVRLLDTFYGPFHTNLERAAEEMVHAKAESQPSDYKCDSCGRPMVYRFSKNGRYLACTGYPDCTTTCPVDEKGRKIERTVVDLACPTCGQPMVLRRGRYGPFLSCSEYPGCKGVVNLDKSGCVKPLAAPPLQVDLPCPKCASPLNLRRSKRGPWLGCSKYPKCRGRVPWKSLPDENRKELELQLLNHEKQHPQPTIRRLDGTPIGENHRPEEIGTAGNTDQTTPPPRDRAPA